MLETNEVALEAHRGLVRQADLLFGARHFAHCDMPLAQGEDLPFGPEPHQSSENAVKPSDFKDWAKSVPARYFVPHEYAHSWNGKFRRPRDVWTPDFNTRASNSLLWVYEGQTQYWGEVLAARSGMMSSANMAGRKLPIEWESYQRFEDYDDEGALIWLDVDARIREMSGEARSLDDFARAFFGMQDGRVAPLLYDFSEVIEALNQVQRFDWATLLRERLDSMGSDAAFAGLARSGWQLGWSDKQTDYGKSVDGYFESANFVHSLGLSIGKEGKLTNVLWNSPAFDAGLTSGLTVLAVNMRAHDADLLREAVTAAKGSAEPIELLLKDGADYRIARIAWHGGLRYPKLERIEGSKDLLTPRLSAR